jgi:hypothetical protein
MVSRRSQVNSALSQSVDPTKGSLPTFAPIPVTSRTNSSNSSADVEMSQSVIKSGTEVGQRRSMQGFGLNTTSQGGLNHSTSISKFEERKRNRKIIREGGNESPNVNGYEIQNQSQLDDSTQKGNPPLTLTSSHPFQRGLVTPPKTPYGYSQCSTPDVNSPMTYSSSGHPTPHFLAAQGVTQSPLSAGTQTSETTTTPVLTPSSSAEEPFAWPLKSSVLRSGN